MAPVASPMKARRREGSVARGRTVMKAVSSAKVVSDRKVGIRVRHIGEEGVAHLGGLVEDVRERELVLGFSEGLCEREGAESQLASESPGRVPKTVLATSEVFRTSNQVSVRASSTSRVTWSSQAATSRMPGSARGKRGRAGSRCRRAARPNCR